MESENLLSIKIIDTGCGIPKSFRSALFQPFRQADSSLTRPKQGTGLGLSIVKHLVQRMAGEVDVESVEGEGSTFTVKLPVTMPSNSPLRPFGQLAVRKRIKVVYRHERTAKLFVDLWTRLGFVASRGAASSTLADLTKDTDIVWTDGACVKQSKALRQLMLGHGASKLPALFIVHSDVQEVAPLEPGLSQAKGTVLVKRPVITHAMVEMLQDPEPHLGSHIGALQSRVRFALPESKLPITPLEELKETSFTPKSVLGPLPSPPAESPPPPPVPPQSPALDERERILLVEDNMVRLG